MAIQTPNFRPTNHQTMIQQLLGRAERQQAQSGFDSGQLMQVFSMLGGMPGGGGDFMPTGVGDGPATTVGMNTEMAQPQGGPSIRDLL